MDKNVKAEMVCAAEAQPPSVKSSNTWRALCEGKKDILSSLSGHNVTTLLTHHRRANLAGRHGAPEVGALVDQPQGQNERQRQPTDNNQHRHRVNALFQHLFGQNALQREAKRRKQRRQQADKVKFELRKGRDDDAWEEWSGGGMMSKKSPPIPPFQPTANDG